MKILMKALFGFGLICLFLTGINAQTAVKTTEISAPKNYQAIVPENSPQLQALLNRAVGEMLNSYPPRGFKADESLKLREIYSPDEKPETNDNERK